MKLCFDSAIRDAGIRTLIEDGYLSRFRHYTIPAYTPEAVAELYLSDRQRMAEVEAVVIENNVAEYVLSRAKVSDKVLPFDELMTAS